MDDKVTKNKHFISLKWRALFLTSIALLLILGVFWLASGYSGKKPFTVFGEGRSQQYIDQMESLIQQQVNNMMSFAKSLKYLDGIDTAIQQSDKQQLEKTILPLWNGIKDDNAIHSMVLFSPKDDVILLLGRSDIPPKLVQDFRTDWKVRSTISCYETCEIYVAMPWEIDGMGRGMLVLGAELDQVIQRFHDFNQINMVIGIKRSGLEPGLPNYIDRWGTELVSAAEFNGIESLLADLSMHYSRADLFDGVHFKQGDRSFEILLRPLSGAFYPRQGEFYLIADNTENMVRMSTFKNRRLFFVVIGLISVEVLLLLVLHGPLSRLQKMIEVLPLLATKNFGEIRNQIDSLRRHGHLQEESDVLNNAVMHLTHLLEELQLEIQQRAEDLEDKTQALQSEKKFVQSILDTAHALVLTQDNQHKIEMINHYCYRIMGQRPSDLEGESFFSLIPDNEQLPDLRFQFNELVNGLRTEFHHESIVVGVDGRETFMSWHHSLLPGAKEGHRQILSLALDISERKEAEERLSWLASHDSLTGLYNRRRFGEELQKAIAHSRRYERSGAVLFFDLDQFKDVNDTSGHNVGDDLLRRVAERLRIEARDSDDIFRLGGDEFAMLVKEVDADGASTAASRLCQALGEIEVTCEGRTHRVSTSIGIAMYPDHGEFMDELIANADIAMYQAKASGRNGWHIYSPEDQDKERTHERVYWNEKVKEALSKDSMMVLFQPIQHIADEKLSHFEALLRVRDEDGQFLPTYKFIQSAEVSGLIQEVDLRIMDKVLAFKQILERQGEAAVFAINLSGVSFLNPNLADEIANKFCFYGIKPNEIIFEITETAAVEDVVTTAKKIQEIKRLGCKFALDDFGVGFSSLYHFKKLPIDLVKIDGSFIRNLPDQQEDQALVKAIVEVAKVFNLKTVAEFVEDKDTLRILSKLGVDYAQGYHVSKPEQFETIWPDIYNRGDKKE